MVEGCAVNDMLISKYNGVKIDSISSAVSNTWESLEDATARFHLEDTFNLKKFKKTTGIEGRYLAGDYQTTSDFCFAAAEEIINVRKIDRKEIGVLVFVTQFPDYTQPATACVLHKRLGLSQKCIAFDINQGCSGFIQGVSVTAGLLQASDCKYALLLCGDTSAKSKTRGRIDDRNSHSTLLLFGDSGAATLLVKDEGEFNIVSCTNGNEFDAIMIPDHSWRHPWSSQSRILDDMKVFNFSIDAAPKMINDYMRFMNRMPDCYDALVLHQANKFIMNTIGKRTGFSNDKVISSIEKFANTSSASIPNTLVHNYGQEASDENVKVLSCGFGVGLSWGAVEFEIPKNHILPLIHTDEWFDDGLPEE